MTSQTKAMTILKALQDGPSTAYELSAVTGLPPAFVSASLSNMYRSRYVKRSELRNGGAGRGRPTKFLYQICGAGLRKLGGAA